MGRLKTRQRDAIDTREPEKEPYFDLRGVVFARYQPRDNLNLTRLARTDRAAWNLAWGCIKRNQPDLAELLKDPNLQMIADHFGGSIEIEV